MELLSNRFAKLQDLLGARIFPLILDHLEASLPAQTPLDRLYMLEKLEWIESADMWRDFRDLRNHLTHEYPNTPELTVNYLNELQKEARRILVAWQTFQKKAQGLLSITRP